MWKTPHGQLKQFQVSFFPWFSAHWFAGLHMFQCSLTIISKTLGDQKPGKYVETKLDHIQVKIRVKSFQSYKYLLNLCHLQEIILTAGSATLEVQGSLTRKLQYSYLLQAITHAVLQSYLLPAGGTSNIAAITFFYIIISKWYKQTCHI